MPGADQHNQHKLSAAFEHAMETAPGIAGRLDALKRAWVDQFKFEIANPALQPGDLSNPSYNRLLETTDKALDAAFDALRGYDRGTSQSLTGREVKHWNEIKDIIEKTNAVAAKEAGGAPLQTMIQQWGTDARAADQRPSKP
jgi:hypothetical protein